jgi:hypothetical protein
LRLRRVGRAATPSKPDAKAVENDEMIAFVMLRLGKSDEVIGRAHPKACSSRCRGKAAGSIFLFSYQETHFPQLFS